MPRGFFESANNEGIVVWRRQNNSYYPLHMINGIEMIYVNEGTYTLQYADGQYELEKGDMAVTFPMTAYGSVENANSTYSFVCCFKNSLHGAVRDMIYRMYASNPVIRAKDLPPAIPGLIEELLLLETRSDEGKKTARENFNIRVGGRFTESSEKSYLAYSIANEILARCLPMLQPKPYTDKYVGDIRIKIIQYMSQNYKEEISLSSIEKQLNVSKYEISRIFNKTLKMSFYDLLNFLRVSEAKELLLRTDMSVTEISFEVGYRYTSTFNRAFYNMENTTPLNYRKMFKEEEREKKA